MKTPEELESHERSDRIAAIALAVVVALLVWFVVLFMWTSDRDGKVIRFLLWLAPALFIAFSVVAWFMTPRPSKPKS